MVSISIKKDEMALVLGLLNKYHPQGNTAEYNTKYYLERKIYEAYKKG